MTSSSETYAELLAKVYPEEVARETATRVAALVARYRQEVEPDDHRLAASDIALITYGDSIRHPDMVPLKALHRFYRERLKGLIDSIHILPFHPYTSDDGFSVVDYHQVDENLGGWREIEELASEARLMFDAVVNHVSKSSRWFQGYLAGEPEYDDWFIAVDPATDLSAVTRPRALPLLSPFPAADGTTRHVWTTFSEDQVDLNFANPEVLLAILEVLLFFVSKGAKYLRLDAIAFLWKTIGTTCIHLPETHQIVRVMRRVVEDLSPTVQVITETNVPHQENIAYLGAGHDMAHQVYNFALPPLVAYSLLTGNAEKLTRWARTLSLPGDQTCFFNFTASHDGVGVRPVEKILSRQELQVLLAAATDHGGAISYKRNPDGSESPYELNCVYTDLLSSPGDSDRTRAARLLASQAIAMAMPGMPAIYIHSLLGSRNDPEAVRRTGHKRSINRAKLDLEPLTRELDDPESLRSIVFGRLRELLRARRSHQAFDPYGAFSLPETDPRVFAISRRGGDPAQEVMCLTNVAGEPVTVPLDRGEGDVRDLITGAAVDPAAITLAGYQTLWLDLGRG